MTDEQARAATGPALTDLQRDRVAFARRDLDDARATDLTTLDPASLILIITRLCTRLDDIVNLLREIACPEQDDPSA